MLIVYKVNGESTILQEKQGRERERENTFSSQVSAPLMPLSYTSVVQRGCSA